MTHQNLSLGMCRKLYHHFPHLHNTKRWITLKQTEIFQKGKHHSLLWKAFQIHSNYLFTSYSQWRNLSYSRVQMAEDKRTENLIKIVLQAPNAITKKTLGDHAYMCAAPKLWNSLPYHVRNEIYFSKSKILLMTHLFNLAFN